MKRSEDPTLCAQAGLRASIGALLDDYPKAVKDGRADIWLKAVVAIAEWYAYIDRDGIDGARKAQRLREAINLAATTEGNAGAVNEN